jgi:hypothetical protein
MAPPASKVFISYNRADRDWAEWIGETIETAGYELILQAWHGLNLWVWVPLKRRGARWV